MKRINVLSLFDGMACGMLAFQKAGIQGDKIKFKADAKKWSPAIVETL